MLSFLWDLTPGPYSMVQHSTSSALRWESYKYLSLGGMAKHSGSICASHPAVTGLILGISEFFLEI